MSPEDNWKILALHNPVVLNLLSVFDGCTIVRSFDSAIQALNSRRFDVIVLPQDIGISGESLRNIRRANCGNDAPVIVLGGKRITDDCLVEWIPDSDSLEDVRERIVQYARIGRRLMQHDALDKKDEVIVECRHRMDELEHYLYCATHDLKSPLMTFVGYLSYIRRDLDNGRNDRIPRFINTIENTAKRMRNVINDMLELCRVGHVTLSFNPVDIGDLIQSIASEHQSQLIDSGVSLTVKSEMPIVKANGQLLRQLFENLLTNAIKYGREVNKPCVEILYLKHNEEHRFCVRDNGPGIAPQYHDMIFDLFQRLDNEDVNGTGVGLTLVRRIAECHQGRVWVDSEPGKGATFWFSIPIEQKNSEHLNAA